MNRCNMKVKSQYLSIQNNGVKFLHKFRALRYIVKTFLNDTITDLDMVITDSYDDPQYSAITVYKRLEAYLQYSQKKKDVLHYIEECGYDENDIRIFVEKYNKEVPAYREYTDPDVKPICCKNKHFQ